MESCLEGLSCVLLSMCVDLVLPVFSRLHPNEVVLWSLGYSKTSTAAFRPRWQDGKKHACITLRKSLLALQSHHASGKIAWHLTFLWWHIFLYIFIEGIWLKDRRKAFFLKHTDISFVNWTSLYSRQYIWCPVADLYCIVATHEVMLAPGVCVEPTKPVRNYLKLTREKNGELTSLKDRRHPDTKLTYTCLFHTSEYCTTAPVSMAIICLLVPLLRERERERNG